MRSSARRASATRPAAALCWLHGGRLFLLHLPVLSDFAMAPMVVFPVSLLHLSLVFLYFLFFGSSFSSSPLSGLSCPFSASCMVPAITREESRLLGPPSASFLVAANYEALSHVPLSLLKSFANCNTTTTKLRSSHFGNLGSSLSCSIKPQFPHVYQVGGPGGHRLLFSQDPSGPDIQ